MAKTKEAPLTMEELCEKIDALEIPNAVPATGNDGVAIYIGLKAGVLKKWGQGFVILDGNKVETPMPARTIYEYLIENYKPPKKSSLISSPEEDEIEETTDFEETDYDE